MLKVSVIMPVYNVERFLENSINSVLNQTFTDFELILVDDGSPDNSPAICDLYAKKDHRIKVIHKENGGLSSARNSGLEIATGKYVYFIDSDDTIEAFTLQCAYKSAEENKADMVIVGVEIKNIVNGQEVGGKTLHRPKLECTNEQIGNVLPTLVSESMYNYAWDKLYKLDIIKKNKIKFNGFYDRVCEDTIFLYDLLPFVQKIITIPEICYNYMIRDDQSVVKKFIPERFEKYIGKLEKLKKICNVYQEQTIEMEKIFYRDYLLYVSWSIANIFHRDCNYSSKEIKKYYKWMMMVDSIKLKDKRLIEKFFPTDESRAITLLLKLYIKEKPWLMTIVSSVVKSLH